MSAFDNLENAVLSLNKSVSNFPIGAISLDDFKPTEEKIRDTRKSLKRLTARLLLLKAKTKFVMEHEEPKDEIERTIEDLQTATVRLLQNDRTFKLVSHSYTIQDILAGKQGDLNMQDILNVVLVVTIKLKELMPGHRRCFGEAVAVKN